MVCVKYYGDYDTYNDDYDNMFWTSTKEAMMKMPILYSTEIALTLEDETKNRS